MTETTATTTQQVDVTAVLANIDAGEALRDRIKAMQAELKVHEDLVKAVLGEALEGVDSKGQTVVRFPHRNRSDLDRKKVQELLTDEQYGECIRQTSYRTLLYGEG